VGFARRSRVVPSCAPTTPTGASSAANRVARAVTRYSLMNPPLSRDLVGRRRNREIAALRSDVGFRVDVFELYLDLAKLAVSVLELRRVINDVLIAEEGAHGRESALELEALVGQERTTARRVTK